ncbi:hypothetical protein CGMCC3_g14207 [Colletotrichum fructicola]|nr:uncharacterized protein CGMCC3_g14207 [Colletotrichum fructicola]KAE9569647.1 hypothetical protein CGMCC3_g14207 [Colletotrichum fructicola]
MAAPSQAGRRPLGVALLLDNGNGQSIDMQRTSSGSTEQPNDAIEMP